MTATASGTTRDKQNKSYVESPTRPDFTAQEVFIGNNSIFGRFDRVDASYPDAITEVYTYSLNGTNIGTITVTYLNSNKKDISSVVYVEL